MALILRVSCSIIFGAEAGFILAQVRPLAEMIGNFYDANKTGIPIPPALDNTGVYIMCGALLGAIAGLSLSISPGGCFYWDGVFGSERYDRKIRVQDTIVFSLLAATAGVWIVAFVFYFFHATFIALLLPAIYPASGLCAVITTHSLLHGGKRTRLRAASLAAMLVLAIIEFQTFLFGLGRFSMYTINQFEHLASSHSRANISFTYAVATTGRMVLPLFGVGILTGWTYLAVREFCTLLSAAYRSRREEAALEKVSRKVENLVRVRAVDQLILSLRSKNADLRWKAAWGLGELRDAQAVEPLILLALFDRVWRVQEAAVVALGQIGSAESVEFLIALMKAKPDEAVRANCACALAQANDAKAIEAIRELLTNEVRNKYVVAVDRDTWLMRRLIEAMSLGGNRAVGPLVELLGTNVPNIRYIVSDAVRALLKTGGVQAVERLISTLCDDQWGVREHAASVLKEFHSSKKSQDSRI
jgi:hypothetical protein